MEDYHYLIQQPQVAIALVVLGNYPTSDLGQRVNTSWLSTAYQSLNRECPSLESPGKLIQTSNAKSTSTFIVTNQVLLRWLVKELHLESQSQVVEVSCDGPAVEG